VEKWQKTREKAFAVEQYQAGPSFSGRMATGKSEMSGLAS
jgi:hypothetical protein